jgi:L-ascorbate metabolism protein UlaG (beta-lactamase superfamily)
VVRPVARLDWQRARIGSGLRSRMDDKGITVRLVKFGHACVRVESDDSVVVIDPGKFSESESLDGADAVLFTHEHVDHVDTEKLADALERRPSLRIYTHAAVAEKLTPMVEAVTVVDVGEEFEAAGVRVKAFGGIHAEIHRDIPRIVNLGYLVAGSVYHPGDAFAVPKDVEVQTLFVPLSAPWARFADSIDFVKAVAPRRAVALHDALLSDAGLSVYNGNMRRLSDVAYAWIEPGQALPSL